VFVVNGGYQSVAVEFDEFAVVIEGLQSAARAAEIVEATHAAIPGKPIRYVVTTHAHFDHISGLREFVAEGATILVHEMDVAFYEAALGAPRTLNPDRAAGLGAVPMVQGVTGGYVIGDGTHRIELHEVRGSLHADDMMIAYLPAIRTIVEADLVQPWMNPAFADGAGGDGPHPYLVHLAGELDRLALEYDQFVPVHRPTPAPTVSKPAFLAAAGRVN
jgi:glyoxylase-like metal-dependent hydrolase (beta-lactamase superfamily II)